MINSLVIGLAGKGTRINLRNMFFFTTGTVFKYSMNDQNFLEENCYIRRLPV